MIGEEETRIPAKVIQIRRGVEGNRFHGREEFPPDILNHGGLSRLPRSGEDNRLVIPNRFNNRVFQNPWNILHHAKLDYHSIFVKP